MNNAIGNIVLFLACIALLAVLFHGRIDRSANHRRLYGGFAGIVYAGLLLYDLIAGSETQPLSRVILGLLPAVGGLLLILIAFMPRFQEQPLEFLAWTFWGSLVGLALTAWLPQPAQWAAALVTMLLMLGIQRVEKKPTSLWTR